MPELFDKHGGFRRLHSFTMATIVQIETLRFCRRFLTFDHREAGAKFYDPRGKQYDQMTQAARSGRQNIIEGSERSSTSKDTEMKLTDVARASLSELRGDYEVFILDRGQLPWSVHSPRPRLSTPSRSIRPRLPTIWSTSRQNMRWSSARSTPAGLIPKMRLLCPTPCSSSSVEH